MNTPNAMKPIGTMAISAPIGPAMTRAVTAMKAAIPVNMTANTNGNAFAQPEYFGSAARRRGESRC